MLTFSEMHFIRSFLLRVSDRCPLIGKGRSIFIFAAFLVFAAPSGSWARLGIEYQLQLGNPTGATANTNNHSHFLIQRTQYAMDYNDTTHQANWVSWSFISSDNGSTSRQNSFTADNSLPSGFYKVGNASFDSPYQRGHMCPSADRTTSVADNDATFLMSNMIPQYGANNTGVWATFENDVRALASGGGEVLNICGPSDFSGATLTVNPMKIPGSVWKIVVVASSGTNPISARVGTNSTIIAIKTPNDSSVVSTWSTYVTSVSQIEADTGFTFLTGLPRSVATYLKQIVHGQPVPALPYINSFTPSSAAPGGTVTLSGVNFGSSAPVVKFNGVTAVASVSGGGTQITATVPSGAGTGAITVQTSVGLAASSADFSASSSPPGIYLSTTNLAGFSTTLGNSSSAQSYSVSASSLTNNLTITAPSGYEISLTNGSSFTNNLVLVPVAGTVASTSIYVRIAASALLSTNLTGTIQHVSTGVTSQSLALAGSVASPPAALSLSITNLGGFTSYVGSPSASQSYTVSGSNLTNNLNLTSTGGFEISLTNGSSYGTSLSLAPAGGMLASNTIYVRVSSTNLAGGLNGSVLHQGGGVTNQAVALTGSVSLPPPAVNLSTNSLTGWSTTAGFPSAPLNYTLSASNLSSNLALTMPGGFEASLSGSGTYSSSLSLAPSNGLISPTLIYLRLAGTNPAGSYAGSVVHSSTGLTPLSLSVSGTVTNPSPVLSLSTSSLTGFTASAGSSSASQSYTLYGSNLTSAVGLTASGGFEISLTNGAGYGASLNLNPVAGTLVTNTIYVRIASNNLPGALSGSVLHSGVGLDNAGISLTGVVLSTNSTNAVILARWTFESLPVGFSTNGSFSGFFRPEGGLQTNSAQGFGMHTASSTYTNPSGNGSTKSFSCNTWNTNDYFQFNLSSLGYRGLRLKFDQNGSSTGPLQFRLETSTDGTVFNAFTNYDVPRTNSSGANVWTSGNYVSNSTLSFDLSSLSDLANKTNLFIRLVQRGTNALNNGLVGSGGTSRLDNVEVSGTPLDTNPPVLSMTSGAVISRVVGGTWSEPGVSAVDPEDGVVSVITSGSVNADLLGSYILTYSATDSSGNSSSTNRTVNIILNSANSITADTDGNGLPDLVEYALGGAPTGNSGAILPSPVMTSSNLRITFMARTNDSNLIIRPVVSSSLVETNSWSTNGVVKTAGVATNEGFELQTWETPVSGAVRKFLKLNISR